MAFKFDRVHAYRRLCYYCNNKSVPAANSRYCCPEHRILHFVETTPLDKDGCMNWTGAIGNGHAQLSISDHRNIKAHRFYYELVKGPLKTKQPVFRSCKNKLCMNIKHMYVLENY